MDSWWKITFYLLIVTILELTLDPPNAHLICSHFNRSSNMSYITPHKCSHILRDKELYILTAFKTSTSRDLRAPFTPFIGLAILTIFVKWPTEPTFSSSPLVFDDFCSAILHQHPATHKEIIESIQNSEYHLTMYFCGLIQGTVIYTSTFWSTCLYYHKMVAKGLSTWKCCN